MIDSMEGGISALDLGIRLHVRVRIVVVGAMEGH